MIPLLLMAQVITAGAGPQAPPVACDITLRAWCIIQFDGTVQMKDEGATRTWTLRSQSYSDAGPLTVVEDKFCNGELPGTYGRIASSSSFGADKSKPALVEYASLTREHCGLKFSFYENNPEKVSVFHKYIQILFRETRHGVLSEIKPE